MKKVFALSLMLLFASAVSAVADTEAPATANEGKSIFASVSAEPTNADTLIGKCSKGVYPGWNSDLSGFAIVTMHIDGNRAFGTAHNATAIYRSDTKPTAFPANPHNGAFGDTWTAM